MSSSNCCRATKYTSAMKIVWLLAAGLAFVSASANAQFTLVKISSDTFHNGESQHKTEVEPDTYSWGNTMVAAFQVARMLEGSSDLGFSTTKDGGKTWTHGLLPGLTVYYKGGPYAAASDASVVYNAKFKQWLISSLTLSASSPTVATSISKDGIHWSKPYPVDNSGNADKNWITCDNWPTSPYYGNCYTEWAGVFMSTSTDGGKTWGTPKMSADQASGTGAEPLVLPNGTVVVIFLGKNMQGFTSTDGGKSWNTSFTIANVNTFQDGSGVRSSGLPFPSTGIDKSGKLYVVWSDCSFRTNCSTNDIVMTTSTNGTTWTNPARIPIDPLNSKIDHFMPGLGVDKDANGHLTTTYYSLRDAACGGNACRIDVGFTTSKDGGKTWTAGKQLAGPMQTSWLPNSLDGPMLADYLKSDYVGGNPFGVFIVAKAPESGLFNEAAYTTKEPLLAVKGEPRFSSKGERQISHSNSAHWWINFRDVEREEEVPPSRSESK